MKRMRILAVLLIAVFGLIQCGKQGSPDNTLASSDSRATITQVSSFGTNPGSLAMYKYAPAGITAAAPLVVALHGCTQTASEYANNTDWNSLADKYKFYVVFAETNSSNNSSKCFNWFESGDIARGGGEALSIKQMVDKMKADYSIDASRVFVTGLSAGGFMTVAMAAAYPDVFAGAAVMAGGPYKCATSMTAAFSCMSPGVDKTPAQWGDLARSGYSGYSGSYPLISIWYGTTDGTVKPLNSTELVDQWTNVHGIDQTEDFTESVAGSSHKVYKNANGDALVEIWAIASMGHAITVDPGTGETQGGGTGSYSIDKNIYSSYWAAKFWGLDNSDKEAPVVNVTSPANGATITAGSTTLAASASDNAGVVKVEFYVDGVLKSTDTSAPYEATLDLTTIVNGSHSVKAIAYDAAGNTATDNDTAFTGGTYVDTVAPVLSNDKASGTYQMSVSPVISANEAATIYYTTDGSTPTVNSASGAAPLTLSFSADTTLKFFGKDPSGNASSVQTFSYVVEILPYTETASGTATEHYNAGRLDVNAYLAYGQEYGYMTAFILYHLKAEFGGTWVDEHDLPGYTPTPDTTVPTVNITAPTNGSTVSASVTVTAAASDNIGVAKVEFYVDGTLKATDTASPYEYVLDTTTLTNASHSIKAIAYDAANNTATDDDTSVTVDNTQQGTTTTVEFTSNSTDDGYVKASADGSGAAVGTYSTIAIGRGSDGKFNRAILSFDTSSLPDSATIVRAYIVVTASSVSGTPWANGNSMVIDLKTGNFGSASTTETTDWASAATASQAGSIDAFTSGTKQSSDLSAAGLSAISKTGKTQAKLRFLTNQTTTAYIFITQGTGAKLVVEYQ
ncbi:MAG TPA: hypothetical protein DHW82_09445 [Spirochaetia bacterium]|nr:MAG: hypothetical protein A2Y41_05465 [Spirochaetes bacterium GWB1_36_13]HCL57214.1 hypothetical protein [Spirochaetia bacterium]